MIVDGGMLSNFPVWVFDCDDEETPDWPTFGLLLVEPDPKVPISERIPAPEQRAARTHAGSSTCCRACSTR